MGSTWTLEKNGLIATTALPTNPIFWAMWNEHEHEHEIIRDGFDLDVNSGKTIYNIGFNARESGKVWQIEFLTKCVKWANIAEGIMS